LFSISFVKFLPALLKHLSLDQCINLAQKMNL